MFVRHSPTYSTSFRPSPPGGVAEGTGNAPKGMRLMVQKPGPTTRERRQSDQCPPRGYRWLLHKRKRKETKQGERDRRKPKFPLKEHKGVRHQQHKRGHSPWCGAAERTSLPTREKGKEKGRKGNGKHWAGVSTGQGDTPVSSAP